MCKYFPSPHCPDRRDCWLSMSVCYSDICSSVIQQIAHPVMTLYINEEMSKIEPHCDESIQCIENIQNYILPLIQEYDNYLEKNSKVICKSLCDEVLVSFPRAVPLL